MATAPLNQKMMAVSAIIGWSGLSVHAQVAAMIHGTDIRIKPYITARIFHAIFAGVLTVILLRPAQVIWHKFKIVIPVFYHIPSAKFTFSSILTASTKTAFSHFNLNYHRTDIKSCKSNCAVLGSSKKLI